MLPFGKYLPKYVAAYINIPYLLWVSFASVHNAPFFVLNCRSVAHRSRRSGAHGLRLDAEGGGIRTSAGGI
jgi:hypothetical protein